MANQYKGEVAVEINGEAYTLDLTANAIIEIEDRFKKGIGAILDTLNSKDEENYSGLKTIRTVLFYALQEHHPAITEKQAGKLLSSGAAKVVFPKLLEAVRLAFPQDEPSETKVDDQNPK